MIENEEPEPPKGPWDPTICLVGDIKQSIYRFRQAQVTLMNRVADQIRSVNRFESLNEPRIIGLRKPDRFRDPRIFPKFIAADKLPEITLNKEDFEQEVAAIIKQQGCEREEAISLYSKRYESPRYDLEDNLVSIVNKDKKVRREEGHLDLLTNYRTAPNLLETMNIWFKDVFSERHDILTGDWYARLEEPLRPNPEFIKQKKSGTLEWLLPIPDEQQGPPSQDLSKPLEPFELGGLSKTSILENELIAARLQA